MVDRKTIADRSKYFTLTCQDALLQPGEDRGASV